MRRRVLKVLCAIALALNACRLGGLDVLPAAALEQPRLIKDLTGDMPSAYPPAVWPRELTRVGNRIFFIVSGFRSAQDDPEIWVTDGTATGTRQITSLNAQPPGRMLHSLTVVGDRLFFVYGSALWVMDVYTERLTPLTQQSSYPHASMGDLTAAGDLLYFRPVDANAQLCRSDGTPEGTYCLVGGVTAMGAAMGRGMFFIADSWDQEPWATTDGKRVFRLADVAPGYRDSSNPGGWSVFKGSMFFFAWDHFRGADLYRSDGTPFGTRLAADIDVALNYTYYGTPTTIDLRQHLYFFASDATHQGRLWQTDGTQEGTGPIAAGPNGLGEFVPFARAGGTLLGLAGTGHGEQIALWAFDPITGRSERLKVVRGYWLHSRLEIAGRVVFTSCMASGCEPWISDGTAAGTRLLSDVAPGGRESGAEYYTRLGAEIVFAATDGKHARALWALPAPTGDTCSGDCSGNREVSIDELVSAIGIALGDTGTEHCPSIDRDADGHVTIDDLVAGVSHASSGCGS